jgi:chromosome segregation ATPase
MVARFRYGLEPVLQTRRWELDRLRTELADCNAVLAMRRAEHSAAQQELLALQGDWQALSGGGQLLEVDRFMRLSQYIAERQAHARAVAQALAEVEQKNGELMDEVSSTQAALEAIEAHRAKMQAQFVQHSLRGACRVADDQWIISQTGKGQREYQS